MQPRRFVRLVSLGLLLAAGPAAAQGSLDQYQLTSNGGGNITSSFSWGQEFTPTASSVARVEVYFFGISGARNLTVTIRDGDCESAGSVLGSVTRSLDTAIDNTPEAFDFAVPIAVTPGNLYTIEVSSDSGSNTGSFFRAGNVYAGGRLCLNGVANTDYDMTFASYADDEGIAGCALAPFETCSPAGKSVVLFKDNANDAKDRLVWKASKIVDALDVAAQLGAMTTTSTGPLLFCAWDSSADIDVPLTGFNLLPANRAECSSPVNCWSQPEDRNSASYLNKATSGNGIGKFQIKGGNAGKGKLGLIASGENLPFPTPFNSEVFMEQDPRVTIQMHALGTGDCWTASFNAAAVKKNSAAQYKAVAK